MIDQFYILANTQKELLDLVPSATNYVQSDLPAYVFYNDGLTDNIRSDYGKHKFITYDEYVTLENMFGLRKCSNEDSTLFFDCNTFKVVSSTFDLEEENEERFTLLPKGTQSIVLADYLGYNEVVIFTNKDEEIYDFDQGIWISYHIWNNYKTILWKENDPVDEYKQNVIETSVKEEQSSSNKQLSMPDRKDCDIVINFKNDTSFYRFPTITSDCFSFQVFDREHNEWIPSKVGSDSIFKMIEEGYCKLIHMSELGKIYMNQYKFNNKFKGLLGSFSSSDYEKLTQNAKSLMSLLNRLK